MNFFSYSYIIKLVITMDLIIGSHVGFRKDDQLIGSVKESVSYGSNTFMFYTGAPQNTTRYPIIDNFTKEALKLMKDNNIDINNIGVHAPYIINPANNKNFDFNVRFLKEEIKRVQELGVKILVLHPGSHVGLGIDKGIQNIIDTLNASISESDNICICLETMAGKGSELGKTFEELKRIIDGVNLKGKLGICMDTCHLNDAGYDLTNFDDILNKFDRIIGLKYLKIIHINDSKNTLESHKDRHENIGFGYIGFDKLLKIIYHEKLKGIPKILETPYVSDKPPYKHEIDMIKKKKFNKDLISDILK